MKFDFLLNISYTNDYLVKSQLIATEGSKIMLKKQLIMQNALELFATQGIEATSIQQITERSGISKGAFYLSFKSKDELVLAMVHTFMTDLLLHIDSLVTKTSQQQNLLYHYFYFIYTNFNERASFAKVLMNDLPKTLNTSLLEQLQDYDRLMTMKLRTIIEKQFPNLAPSMINDTIFFTRGLVGMYGELFFRDMTPPDDLHTFCHALVEKVTIQATYATLPVIEEGMLIHPFYEPVVSKQETMALLQQLIQELPDALLREAAILLHEQLQAPTLSPVLLEGLLQTMSAHAETKWLAIILRCHFQLHEKR